MITPITKVPSIITNPAAQAEKGNEDFGTMLTNALSEVNDAQVTASNNVKAVAEGKPVELHQVMISMEKASVAMQLTLQIRNKVLEAYQEISHTQI